MTNRNDITMGRVGAGLRASVETETDAQYLERIDREIAEGLRDLETGNVVSAAEHEADMDRFMAELLKEVSGRTSNQR